MQSVRPFRDRAAQAAACSLTIWKVFVLTLNFQAND
jgi:hypothetical protein